jgi:nitroreductase
MGVWIIWKRIMTTNIDAIKYRRQVRYFTDEIPEESVIKEILEDTVKYAPVKGNLWNFKLQVYGPEWEDEKQKMLRNTICVTPLKPVPEEGVEAAYKTYSNIAKTKGHGAMPWEVLRFNDQVTAPYLIVAMASPSVHNMQNEDQNERDTAVMTGCVGATLAYLTQERGLAGGFCNCFKESKRLGIEPNFIVNKRDEFFFTFGIGYPDKELYTKDFNSEIPSETQLTWPWPEKPNVNDVVEWMT